MRQKVLITEEIHESGIRYLADRGYELVRGTGISEETVCREAADCEAILTRNAPVTEKVMQAAPKLKVIAMHGVGVDLIDLQAAAEHGIYVVNAPGSNSRSVAEYTVGLMLGLTRHIPLYDRALRAGNSGIRGTVGGDLGGKTLGVVGMGNIGSRVAQIASLGFGMRVLGYKRRITAHRQDGIEWTDDLNRVIREADFLSLHVPYTPETEKLIGEKELALMKPGAFLINTARGEVLDQDALVRSLENGRLAGAALDVFAGAFPGEGHPLTRFPNVILTPHTAAFTNDALQLMALTAATGVDEVLRGGEPTHAVSKPKREPREKTA